MELSAMEPMEWFGFDSDLCLHAFEHEMRLNGWTIIPDYRNLFVRTWDCGDIEVAVGLETIIEYYPQDDNMLCLDFDFIYSLDEDEDIVTYEGINWVLAKYGLPTVETLKKVAKLENMYRMGLAVRHHEYYEFISGLKVSFEI